MTKHWFGIDVECGKPIANEWCTQKYPHMHGRNCDRACPCNTPANDPNFNK